MTCTIHPQPHTINTKPRTLSSKPSTLHPKPSTLNLQPQTPNPKTSAPNSKPQTLNPKPQTLNPTPQVTDATRPDIMDPDDYPTSGALCVCERERECVCVCDCVCVRERVCALERERKSETHTNTHTRSHKPQNAQQVTDATRPDIMDPDDYPTSGELFDRKHKEMLAFRDAVTGASPRRTRPSPDLKSLHHHSYALTLGIHTHVG